MKTILMSIQPKWCELIASGEKTVEVRKTKPKLDVPFKCYIYQTKESKRRYTDHRFNSLFSEKTSYNSMGKVIGEFVCDKIYNITPHFDTPTFPNQYICGWEYGKDFDCLTFEELTSYMNGKKGYGYHISDLVIYDKPRELSEFFHACDKPRGTDCSVCLDRRENKCKSITRPPQSWCYVEEGGE